MRLLLARFPSLVLAVLAALCFALSSGCADDAHPDADKAVFPSADAATGDLRRDPAEGGPSADKALVTLPDGRLPADLGLASPCTGPCAQQSLVISFGATTAPLERSVYGIDRDQAGLPGLYVEALHGGFAGCPEQDSPTPDRTLIISGLPLPEVGAPLTLDDGLVISLIDYQGTLLPGAVLSKATAATIHFVAARVCPTCTGQPEPSDPGGYVALELEATFPEGTITGHLYATHCDSLDL